MKNKKPQGTRTADYLQNIKPEKGYDGTVQLPPPKGTPPPGCIMNPRLGVFVTPKLDYDPGCLAESLAGAEDRVLYFCDNSLFDEQTDPRIWDALFSKKGKVVIIPPVYQELKPWLDKHPDHVAARAVKGRSEAVYFAKMDEDDTVKVATTEYYVNLLAQRKRLVKLAIRGFESKHGRQPNDVELKQILDNLHNREVGPRGYLLAKKGAADDGSKNFYTDEILVVMGAMACINHAREVIILTKDEDLLEQLYKLQHALDTQYRSMLLADRYLTDPDSLVAFPMPNDVKELSEVFQVNDGVMIERTDRLAEEILPPVANSIPVHCWVIGKTYSQLTFMAETEMQALLSAKGKTRGLNTAKLSGKNCHFWLAPLLIPETLRKCAVIATDRRLAMGTKDVPYLDFLQMINCMERFKLVEVEGNAAEIEGTPSA